MSKHPVLSIQTARISIKLREVIDAHARKTGERLTYRQIAELTGLDEETIQSIAVRPNYNARISTIARLCAALKCTPAELLEFQVEQTEG
jgi:putative transcriptional regulator